MNYPYIPTQPQWNFNPRNIWLIIFVILVLVLLVVQSCKADVVSVAQSEIGHREQYGNNRGIYVRQYLNGKEGLPWCAGFVSYCLKKAGYKLPYTLRARDFLKYGKLVNNPQAGDLIIFSRQGGEHIGIIEKMQNNIITTIEGNAGKYPAKVREFTYKHRPKNLLGFIRLTRR